MIPRRALAAVLLAGLLPAAACALEGGGGWKLDESVLASWPGLPGVRFGVEGTGRGVGHVANLLLVNEGGDLVAVSLPAGDVLQAAPGRPTLQRYGLWDAHAASLAPGERIWLQLAGACLDPDLPPWPPGTRMPAAAILAPRAWASQAEDGTTGALDARRLVALLATTRGPFEAAKKDPAYVSPDVSYADDVVRQWAVNATIGGKKEADLEAAIARESPSVPDAERKSRADRVWAAAQVVVATGGKAAAKDAGIDWAALDLTLKP